MVVSCKSVVSTECKQKQFENTAWNCSRQVDMADTLSCPSFKVEYGISCSSFTFRLCWNHSRDWSEASVLFHDHTKIALTSLRITKPPLSVLTEMRRIDFAGLGGNTAQLAIVRDAPLLKHQGPEYRVVDRFRFLCYRAFAETLIRVEAWERRSSQS